MVRNFEKFEVGHWYIYTGCERLPQWSRMNDMNFVLSHKPQLCERSSHKYASKFADTYVFVWDWENGFDNWIEIEDPSGIYDLKIGEFYYDKRSNTVEKAFDNYMVCKGNPCFALKRKEEKKTCDCLKVDVSLKSELEEYDKDRILLYKQINSLQNELLQFHKERSALMRDRIQTQGKEITALKKGNLFNDSGN